MLEVVVLSVERSSVEVLSELLELSVIPNEESALESACNRPPSWLLLSIEVIDGVDDDDDDEELELFRLDVCQIELYRSDDMDIDIIFPCCFY